MAYLKQARVLSVALLFLTAAAAFLAGVAWKGSQAAAGSPEEGEAAEGEAGEERGRPSRRLVIDEVGLEPAKRAEVQEIIQHFRAQMRALDEEFRETYQPRQRDLFRLSMDSIKAILEPAHWATYDSLLTIRFRNRGNGRDSPAEGRERGRPERRQ